MVTIKPEELERYTKRRISMATRKALEDTFLYWLQTFAPHHFKRQAFSRYPTYANNYKRRYRAGRFYDWKKERTMAALGWRIKKGQDTDRPLVKTGATEKAFLEGNIQFRGNNFDFKAVWKDLPKHAYQYKLGQWNKHDAYTDLTPSEYSSLENFFNKRLMFHLDSRRRIPKAAGFISGRR